MTELNSDIQETIKPNYSWIKVKKFVDDPSLPWEDRFERLEQHHKEETEFLINIVEDAIRETCETTVAHVNLMMGGVVYVGLKYRYL